MPEITDTYRNRNPNGRSFSYVVRGSKLRVYAGVGHDRLFGEKWGGSDGEGRGNAETADHSTNIKNVVLIK